MKLTSFVIETVWIGVHLDKTWNAFGSDLEKLLNRI